MSRIRCSRVSLSSRRRASLSRSAATARTSSVVSDTMQRTPPTVPSASRTADRNVEIDGLSISSSLDIERTILGREGLSGFADAASSGSRSSQSSDQFSRAGRPSARTILSRSALPTTLTEDNASRSKLDTATTARPRPSRGFAAGVAAPERPGRRGQQDCAANPPLAHRVKTSGKEKVVHASASKAKIRVATVAFCYGFLREPKL